MFDLICYLRWKWIPLNKEIKIPYSERQYIIKLLETIDDKSLRLRISNLCIWYIDKAEKNKLWHTLLSGLSYLSTGLIPIVNLFELQSNSKITTILALLSTTFIALNNFKRNKENWLRYRKTIEEIKITITYYTVQYEMLNEQYSSKLLSEEEYIAQKCHIKNNLLDHISDLNKTELNKWHLSYQLSNKNHKHYNNNPSKDDYDFVI